jgi:hypothetical protein
MPSQDPIDRLIKRLFPLPKRLKLIGAPQEHRRALALTVLLLTVSWTTWFWSVALSALYLLFHLDIVLNVIFSIAVSALMALQVWGFYRFSNLRVAAMLFTLSYFLMVLTLVLISGGYQSVNLVLLISCPALAFRVGGKDEGIMNSVFVGLVGLALAIVDKLGLPIVNILTGIDQGILFGIAWVVTISVITTCLVTYDMDES